jgi:hypothetical protein
VSKLLEDVVDISDHRLTLIKARDQNPYLKRFQNDWATEEIVKQYFKNKRKNHYKKGWLTVPEKYKHLKGNSNRRNASGSRRKRANLVASTSTSTS